MRSAAESPRDAHPTGFPPVGGRLQAHWDQWEKINPGRWVLSVVREGYRLEFSSQPPPDGLMKTTPIPQSLDQRRALEGEIEGLLLKEAIVPAPPDVPLFRSSFFLTTKKDGSWRPILNLRPLNRAHIRTTSFRMETLKSIIPQLPQAEWATSVDLKDAYLHVPIHPFHQRFLAFRYREQDYIFRAMPFGLATAPRVFTSITRAILAHLRRQGLRVFAYLDDWLVVASSRRACIDTTSRVLNILHDLGWVVNETKSQLAPAQEIVYLGAAINLRTKIVRPTEERVASLVQLAASILQDGHASALSWQRLLGMMASLVDVLHLCRLRMRPLQQNLRAQFNQNSADPSTRVLLPEGCRPFLAWWTQPSNVNQGISIVDRLPQATITTDASLMGWGATFGAQTTSGLWTPAEAELHINVLETMAVHHAILHWATELSNHKVTVLSDNSTTVAYINRQGGTRSRSLLQKTWDLLTLSDEMNIHLRASHLAGDLNVVADALSRGTLDENEWSLSQTWATFLFDIFGRPSVDIFAKADNYKLPTFCTRRAEPTAWRTDAFSFQWDGMFLYAFPPWRLIYKVLSVVQRSDVDMILVAPCWPQQPWFPLLLELLVDLPFAFPQSPRLLTQQRGRVWHNSMESLHLSAWKLSGNASRRQGFHSVLRTLQQQPAGLPRLELTIPDSNGSDSGAPTRLLIPWRHPAPN